MGAATPGGSLLLLGLGTLILGWGCWAQDTVLNPDWGFTSYEVIIPRQLVLRGGGPDVAGRRTYLLRIGGRKNVVHLRPKKLLLSRHLRVFTFTEDGSIVEDQPYIPTNCNFGGSVEGSPRSEAVLSTCLGGLRGMLKIDDRLYQIEPIRASYSFEHVVYHLKDNLIHNFTCGLTDQEINRQLRQLEGLPTSRFHNWRETYIHQKYMELMIVTDNFRYRYLESNVTEVVNEAIVMTGLMDAYFQALNLRLHLQAVEIWTDNNKINTDVPNLFQVLKLFTRYRRDVQYPRIQTDWSHLFVKQRYPDTVGWANVGSVCSRDFGASTSTLPDRNLVATATWSTHELGHGVGLPHVSWGCYCQGTTQCIMSYLGRYGFSNCSFINYYNFVMKTGDCLDNVPGIPYSLASCGNKVVDKGEQCDCGTNKECQKDLCCQTNCKLKPGAQCNSGLCCTNCRFTPSGRVCRGQQNACDLVEFCNGTTNICPKDFYKQDGTQCSRVARCYLNGCHERFSQCRRIFGSGARNAPLGCYSEVNQKNDRFGNCGVMGRGYKPCRTSDVLCGRLQCVNIRNVPKMPEHTTVIFTHVKEFNLRCWGLDYHSGMVTMELPDDGAVKDGTGCGTNLMCINRTCHSISVLKYDCNPEKCNRRGVCNNMRHCHCNYGWAPPFCEYPGFGGSIDSGPAGKMKFYSKTFKVLPIMLIRLILLGITFVLAILKEMIGRFFKG